MKNNNRSLSRGQKSKFPAIALGLSLAMAAPALADFSGSKTILSGATENVDGNIARTANTDITVNVGGTITGGEFIATDEWGFTLDMDIFGTGEIEQLKLYGDGASTTVVGNGTDAATLTILEGNLGKYGASSLTVAAGSNMISTGGDWMHPSQGLKEWDDAFSINGAASAYIDLLGTGTFKINADNNTALFEASLKGNGVLGNWVKTQETIGGLSHNDTYNVYTAVPEPATMSLLAIGGLALIRRKRRA